MIHSILPPSSGHIWAKPNGCTGWVLMSAQYPELEESQDSKDGTASHEIGHHLIDNPCLTWTNFNGVSHSNGVLYTEEMFDCAKIYADDVITILTMLTVSGYTAKFIEQKLDIKRIHDLCFGTPDCYVYNQATGNLYIWDYKFGREMVEAFENWQLLIYICGILDKLGINGSIDQNTTVHMRIIQPRAFHREGIIREWTINAGDLRAYFNIIHANAEESLGSNSVIRSGPYCKHCTARHACPAALRGGVQLYEVAQQPVAIELPPMALGVQYSIVKRAIKQLECIETGMKEQIKSLNRKGTLVPGWQLEGGKGKESWNKPVSEVIAMGDAMKRDLRKEQEAITPKQAIAKGIDKSIVAQYSHTTNTGLQLVPDNANKAKRLFS